VLSCACLCYAEPVRVGLCLCLLRCACLCYAVPVSVGLCLCLLRCACPCWAVPVFVTLCLSVLGCACLCYAVIVFVTLCLSLLCCDCLCYAVPVFVTLCLLGNLIFDISIWAGAVNHLPKKFSQVALNKFLLLPPPQKMLVAQNLGAPSRTPMQQGETSLSPIVISLNF